METLDVPLERDVIEALQAVMREQPELATVQDAVRFGLRDWLTGLGLLRCDEDPERTH